MGVSTVENVVPVGEWALDGVHSSVGFGIRHLGLNEFSGSFEEYGVELVVGDSGDVALSGYVDVESIAVDQPDLRGHLLSPEFFDAERHARITYVADRVEADGGDVVINGVLTIKGQSLPVEVRGVVNGPAVGLDDKRHLALELSAVIDRTQYGLDWQAVSADGTKVLADEVTLTAAIQLVDQATS